MNTSNITRAYSAEAYLDVGDEYALIRVLQFMKRLRRSCIRMPAKPVDESKILRECIEELGNVIQKFRVLRVDLNIPESTYHGLEECQEREGQPDMGKLCVQVLEKQISKYPLLDDAA